MIRRKPMYTSSAKLARTAATGAQDGTHLPTPRKATAPAKKALRRIDRLLTLAQTGENAATEWEREFLSGVKERIETYGRAFADPEKGDLSAPVSIRQGIKIHQIRLSLNRHRNAEAEQQPTNNEITQCPNH
jgi:hypothetical protein